MPTLSPDVDFNVAVESPVAPTNYNGLASLVGTMVESAADSWGVNEAALDRELVRGLKKVRALHDAGRSNEAYALETTILSRYTSYGGNLGSTRIKTVVQGITGRDPEDFGNSPEEVALQDTLKSEEFQAAVLGTYATNPDASPDERREIALGTLAMKEGRGAILEQAAFNWTAEGEAAFMGEIKDFEDQLMGALAIAGEEGDSLNLEEAQEARMTFMNFRRTINSQRPANVSNDEWSSITARLDQVGDTLEYLEKLVGPDNVGAQSVSKIQQAIKSADIPDVKKNLALQLISSDPEVLVQLGLPISEFAEIIKALDVPQGEGLTPSQLRDTKVTDPWPDQSQKDLSSEQVYTNLNGAMNGSAFANQIVTNSDQRELWGQAVTRGFSNLNELAARGEWMTPEQYDKLFSENFFEQLDSIKDVDPRLHEALTNRAQRALTTTGTSLQERYNSLAANSPFAVDTNGNVGVTEAGLRRFAEPAIADRLIKAATANYDPDPEIALNMMFEDNGAQLTDYGDRRAFIGTFGDAQSLRRQTEEIAGSMWNVLAVQRRLSNGTESDLDPMSEMRPDGPNVPMPADVQSDEDFFVAVAGTAGRLNANPNHLLRAIHFETAGTFDPALEHSGANGTSTTAMGLIGFMDSTARSLGYTRDELKRMSRAEQMSVVEQYLEREFTRAGVTEPDFTDIYTAIHYPAALGKGPNYVMYRRGTKAYQGNAGLDTNGDGTVTVREAADRAWGVSSNQARMPGDMGALILEQSRDSAASRGTTEPIANPDATRNQVDTSQGEPTDTEQSATESPAFSSTRGEGRTTASQAATKEQKEQILALFPNINPEQVEAILQILQTQSEGE